MRSPIGLFDSGLGGLTVLKVLKNSLPQESFIYLADTQNLPYGDKSKEEIIGYARQNASALLKKGIKLLVIPCHTACSHALAVLEKELSVPIVGVTRPSLLLMEPFHKIAILGTKSTVNSGFYQTQGKALFFPLACPLFVPLIEGLIEKEENIIQQTLFPLKGKVEAALLACTHFPLIQEEIQKGLGEEVKLLDPAELTCQLVKQVLVQYGLLSNAKKGDLHFFVTSDPQKFESKAEKFWGSKLWCQKL